MSWIQDPRIRTTGTNYDFAYLYFYLYLYCALCGRYRLAPVSTYILLGGTGGVPTGDDATEVRRREGLLQWNSASTESQGSSYVEPRPTRDRTKLIDR